jgi:hypothetical protein
MSMRIRSACIGHPRAAQSARVAVPLIGHAARRWLRRARRSTAIAGAASTASPKEESVVPNPWLIALAILLSFPCRADFRTLGAPDCHQWNASSGSLKMQHRMWMLGFLTGMNAIRYEPEARNDWLRKIADAEQAFLWIDGYCTVHPDETLVAAGMALSDELQRIP